MESKQGYESWEHLQLGPGNCMSTMIKAGHALPTDICLDILNGRALSGKRLYQGSFKSECCVCEDMAAGRWVPKKEVVLPTSPDAGRVWSNPVSPVENLSSCRLHPALTPPPASAQNPSSNMPRP
jgi:hypothetical protein